MKQREKLQKPDTFGHLHLVEFFTVCFVFVLPPLFSTKPLTVPPQPHSLLEYATFACTVFAAAAYEELLYRLYLPYRIKQLIQTRDSIPPLYTGCIAELLPLCFFALGHRYLGTASVLFAAAAGIGFRVLYIRLKKHLPPTAAACSIIIIHGCWNIGVYRYLQQ